MSIPTINQLLEQSVSLLQYTADYVHSVTGVNLTDPCAVLRSPPPTPLPIVQPVQEIMAFVRLAGLSGAIAVGLGAYGAHAVRDNPDMDDRRKQAYDTGSRYHMIHTLALLGASKARFPLLTGATLIGGMALFCGPCYHYCLTGDTKFRKFTPAGGILLILGWLTFIL